MKQMLLKKKSCKLCITIKYKYKIHDKIYPIQHSACSDNWVGKGTTRCIEETNGDEYKNITTRNCCPSWTSWLSIMNIAASTMTLQTNCRHLYPSGLSVNYNRCPCWTRGNGVIHPVWTVHGTQERHFEFSTFVCGLSIFRIPSLGTLYV
jgi:hypothetical protein